MTTSRRSRKTLPLLGAAMLAVPWAVPVSAEDLSPAAGDEAAPVREAVSEGEREARRLFRMGERYLEQKEYEKGVKAFESILEQYPGSEVRYDVHLVLGRHYFTNGADPAKAVEWLKRNRELESVEGLSGAKLEAMLESLYLMGVCHYHQRQYDKLFSVLRKVTADYPNSVWANQSYYYLGMAHFIQQNWSKAIEYLSLVGTFVDPEAPTAQFVEAGRRFYVKIQDGDLPILYKFGNKVSISIRSGSGDTEAVELVPLSARQGLFIGSISTEMGPAKPRDGRVQVVGGDSLTVTYADNNTLEGQKDVPRSQTVKVVSSGTLAFTKGTYDEFSKHAFTNQPVHLSLKDADLDTSPAAEAVTVRVVTRYLSDEVVGDEAKADPFAAKAGAEGPTWRIRDEVTVRLAETVPDQDGKPAAGPVRSGHFIGSVPIEPQPTSGEVSKTDDSLVAVTGDEVAAFYTDELHAGGDVAREVVARVSVLGAFNGGLTPASSEHADQMIKARKNVTEGQAFLELARIFKSMGLVDGAKERVTDGLIRADQVIGLSAIPADLRQQAFKLRWELFLVSDQLDQAIATLSIFNQYFPESRFADEALVGIGKIHMQRKEYDLAVTVFTRVLNLAQSESKAEAQFRIAEALEAKGGALEPAIPAYKAVADRYGDSEFAGDALGKLVIYHSNSGDYAQANDLLEQIFIDHPDKPWLDKMLMRWVVLAHNMKDYRKAIEKCQKLILEYPDSPDAKKARDILPQLEKKLGGGADGGGGNPPAEDAAPKTTGSQSK